MSGYGAMLVFLWAVCALVVSPLVARWMLSPMLRDRPPATTRLVFSDMYALVLLLTPFNLWIAAIIRSGAQDELMFAIPLLAMTAFGWWKAAGLLSIAKVQRRLRRTVFLALAVPLAYILPTTCFMAVAAILTINTAGDKAWMLVVLLGWPLALALVTCRVLADWVVEPGKDSGSEAAR